MWTGLSGAHLHHAGPRGSAVRLYSARLRVGTPVGLALAINHEAIEKLKSRKNNSTEWNTFAGEMNAGCECLVDFISPEFSAAHTMQHNFHVASNEFSHDMIIGRDPMFELGIDLLCSAQTVHWKDTAETPMCAEPQVQPEQNVLFDFDKNPTNVKLADFSY